MRIGIKENYFTTYPRLTAWLMFGLVITAMVGLRLTIIYVFPLGLLLMVCAGGAALVIAGSFIALKVEVSIDFFRSNPWAHALFFGFAIFSIYYYSSLAPVQQFITERWWFFVPFALTYIVVFFGYLHERRTGVNSFEQLLGRLPKQSPWKLALGLVAMMGGVVFIMGLLAFIVIDCIGFGQMIYSGVSFVIR